MSSVYEILDSNFHNSEVTNNWVSTIEKKNQAVKDILAELNDFIFMIVVKLDSFYKHTSNLINKI